ncbi:hypothetical protein MNB_SV-12-1039 [hydrothermal vent metagenome]|uniref:Porin domain-containing protein n=1 Tax=hydrothermal vent metagenome TaxID=652676 RepID=A0A1W1CE18_9ZZZZ
MKITNLSLAAIAVIGMMSVASADVDMKIGGQAVVYYQTVENGGDSDYFDKGSSTANSGLQLNANGDLGNGFGLGLQGTALSTWGLENNLVGDYDTKADGSFNNPGVMQSGLRNNGDTANASDYFAITKAYLTKKLGKTTLKMGRQELPKSLSPLAFSEGWNVYKNTFDAVVAINSDIPDTTVVGAYVSRSNKHGDLGTFNNLTTNAAPVNKGAYMITVANKSIKQAPVTLTYYDLELSGGLEAASAIWGDVQVDAGLPVKFGLQGGSIMPENNLDDTKAVGAKVTGKAGPVALKLAYSKVNNGTVSLQNVGTGVKTPLYTQMVANQGAISRNADTVVLQAKTPVGPGTLIAQYDMTQTSSGPDNDFSELDVLYKFKALGTTMLAAYVTKDSDAMKDPVNIVRFWTRYNF